MRHTALGTLKLSMVLVCAAAALYAGCQTEKKGTQFVAGITTQLEVPRDLQSVGLVVQVSGKVQLCASYPVTIDPATGKPTVSLPAISGDLPGPTSDPSQPVTITILGFRQHHDDFETNCTTTGTQSNVAVGTGDIFVLRRSRAPYVQGKVLYINMPLRQACSNVACGDGQTCVAGSCKAADTDPGKFPLYRPDLVFGNTTTCFHAALCMQDKVAGDAGISPYRATLSGPPNASGQPAVPIITVVDRNACIFDASSLPADGKKGSLNVRLTYDNFSREILDLDPEEGFSIPDASRPLRFQLAQGLCDNMYKKGRVVSIEATATQTCNTKTPLQPICTDDSNAIIYNGPNAATASYCPSVESLVPTKSMLYVLVDRSVNATPLFHPPAGSGRPSVTDALAIPLQTPALANTKVAFKFLPATQADACTTASAYGKPGTDTINDVPFTDAAQVDDLLKANLAANEPVLTTAPNMNLDGVLQPTGAYGAFEWWRLAQSPPPIVGRRAVLILAQRQFGATCGGSTPAPDVSAAAAFASASAPAFTYTLVVKDLGSDPVNNPVKVDQTSVVADATKIAAAGGTTKAYDDTTSGNSAAVVQALFTAAADLGTCLYETPKSFDITKDMQSSKLSYFDLVQLQRVDIPFNAGCSDATATTTDGWNLITLSAADSTSQQMVRVCGAPCKALHDSVLNSSLINAQVTTGTQPTPQASPPLEMKVSRLCATALQNPEKPTDGGAAPSDGGSSPDGSTSSDGGADGAADATGD